MAKFERAFVAHDEIDDEILTIAYSSIAHSVFTGGNHGIIRKWSFWTVKQMEAEYKGHEDAVVCFAVDANLLYSGSVDCTIRIWETSQGMALKVVKVHNVTVQALLVVPDSGNVASCAFDGRMSSGTHRSPRRRACMRSRLMSSRRSSARSRTWTSMA